VRCLTLRPSYFLLDTANTSTAIVPYYLIAAKNIGSRHEVAASAGALDTATTVSVSFHQELLQMPLSNPMKSLDSIYDRARSVLASGVSAGLRYHPYLAQPFYAREAEGPYLIGEDGRRYLDLNMANGSVIHRIILVFDEVLSGFRMAPGGTLAYFNVTPDVCTLGKALANGFPIAAICGRKDQMEQLSPAGPVTQSGSHAGHFISLSAAEVTLKALSRPWVYNRLQDSFVTFYQVLHGIFNRYAIPAQVEGLGAQFGVYFGRRDSVTTRNRQYTLLCNPHLDPQIQAPNNGQFQTNLCYQLEIRILQLSGQLPLLLPDSFGHTAFRIAALCVRGIA
jgi:4-aminobutyrate aminotransferase-like enzyme